MAGFRVIHHDLRVAFFPDKGTMTARDTLVIGGDSAGRDAGDDGGSAIGRDGEPLLVYLGKGFGLTGATQGQRELGIEPAEEQGRARRYRITGWGPAQMSVTLSWEGAAGDFDHCGVCAICPRVVEMSGFGRWFPTIEPLSFDERFTYRLDVDHPPGWQVVTPGLSSHGDLGLRHWEWLRPIEDIFLCAVPRFDSAEADIGGQRLQVHSSGLDPAARDALLADYARSVLVMTGHFGPMPAGRGGVVVVSPRSPKGEEWGFERGDLWVAGDSFVNVLVEKDWCPDFLPGPMSASLHETIHAWFGLGLRFVEPWLAEAITQYSQVVLSEEMFPKKGLAKAYFDWYVPRVQAALTKDPRPISDLRLSDGAYDHWYLKGSWAFWDLEAALGRDRLIRALATFYRRHVPGAVRFDDFAREMGQLLGAPTEGRLRHWFTGEGFEPERAAG